MTPTTPAVAGRPTGLEAAGEALAEALSLQRTLWGLAADDLTALDIRRLQVPFMNVHDPIGAIDRALAVWQTAVEAARAAQRQAADDDEAYAANKER